VLLAALKVHRPQLVAGRAGAREPRRCSADCACSRLSFWLFRERTGPARQSLGWPVLSLGLGLLVFAGAGEAACSAAAIPAWPGSPRSPTAST
jgi:hypothetical protein